MSSSKEGRERAEAQADKKLQAQKAGAKAMAEYEAAGQAVRERTARLRALRLAKEAAAKEAADQEAVSRTPAAGKKAGKSKSGKAAEKPLLTDWLASQRSQGRRS